MLPFTKRPARSDGHNPNESPDLITTDEIEVVRGAGPGSPRKLQSRLPSPPRSMSSRPPPPSERPRVFQRSVSDDDKTLMMAKPKLSSRPPPPVAMPTPGAARSLPATSMRGLVRRPMDDERTILRPSQMPVARPASSPPPKPSMLPTPYMPFKPPAAGAKPPALPGAITGAITGTDVMTKAPLLTPVTLKPSAAVGKRTDSDPRIDPPAAVITARTRILPKRPNISWGAALMAAGVFVGLVTAVLARGDGDALIDATASFVDPSHNGAPHAAAGSMIQPILADGTARDPKKTAANNAGASCLSPDTTATPTVATVPAVNSPPPPKAEPKPELVASNSASDISNKPEPPKPAPYAYAAPVPAAAQTQQAQPQTAPKATPHWQPQQQASAALYSPPKVAAAPKQAPKPAWTAPAGGGGGGGNDMAGAQAADALAKAQLEASLR